MRLSVSLCRQRFDIQVSVADVEHTSVCGSQQPPSSPAAYGGAFHFRCRPRRQRLMSGEVRGEGETQKINKLNIKQLAPGRTHESRLHIILNSMWITD
jgi:hypothetical protein